MEKTFANKLVEFAKYGQFRPGRDNKNAISNVVEEVMSRHGGKIDYGWGKYVIKFLRERHDVFSKLVTRRDVVWNKRL
ncbi:UNVERIFIED_CONTAM: hypothetical protein Sradi_0219300 [Sesamum radiatum]|uniref:Uncharacterized protein n=1 Tax=Sesamum radiatum TaxID=300843 RepID=A0AAW2VZF1_SESRA